MSKRLNEQLWAVAKEYARQFGEIIGMEPEFWVADNPSDYCCFGDCYYFSLEEMAAVVDNAGRYVETYGSKAAVGQEVRDWADWWVDGMTGDESPWALQRVEARVTRQLRPNINLKNWLDGCPRNDRHPWNGPDAELMYLKDAAAHLASLIGSYGENRSLGNVLVNVNARIKPMEEAKAKRDHEYYENMLKKAENDYRIF